MNEKNSSIPQIFTKKNFISIIDISAEAYYTLTMNSFYETAAETKNYFYFHKRGAYETEAHFHNALELHFVESGEETVLIDGEKRVLRAGDACFCDSFSVHYMSPFLGESCFVLLGEKTYFEQALSAFGGKTPPRFFRFENFALLRALHELCKQERKIEENAMLVFGGTVKILFGELAESVPFVPRKTDLKSALVCNVLQYAEKHIQDDLSLSAIACAMGYSQEHLSRILHSYLMENWKTYVNRLRVRRAETLLKSDPALSVLDAAFACGFESPNTFYRAYKREFCKKPRR